MLLDGKDTRQNMSHNMLSQLKHLFTISK